jgi:hypothetical protein
MLFAMCANVGKETHLYSPTDVIQYILDVDSQSLRFREETNHILNAYGLDYDQHPAESFQRIAHERSSVSICRAVNTVHVMRCNWCFSAFKHIQLLLDSLNVERNQGSRDAWIDLQKAFINIARSEAELVLATIPFYILPGDGPLSQTSSSSLIWLIAMVAANPGLLPTQQARARDALSQIGSRAMISAATKLANARSAADMKLFEQAHIIPSPLLRYTWYFST